jgi:DNA-binding XRE family transcriptional regulator
MDNTKKKKLEAAGWQVGTAQDFLGLSNEESAFIEVKLTLSRRFKEQRTRQGLTQEQVANLLKSSQSRVAKMEAGDASVSLDLLVRSLLALGVSRKDLGRMIAS